MARVAVSCGLVFGALTSPVAVAQQGVELVALDDRAGIVFEHVYGGPAKGYITEMGGSGSAWLDYDLDGWIDLLLVNGLSEPADDPVGASRRGGSSVGDSGGVLTAELAGPANAGGHRFFRNRRGRFEEVTPAAGVGDLTWGNGAAVGDVDNDGFPDLYVTSIGPNRLYRNNGDGTFVAWTAGVEDPGWGTSAAFIDWDQDGNLDLYVANYVDFDATATATLGDGLCFYLGVEVFCGPEGLVGSRDVFYRNRGDGRFEPWKGADVDADRTYGFALVATDCDDDLRPDLYVASDSTINLLYRHTEGAVLEDWSLFSGAGYSGGGREQAGMGVTAADYDGDGDFDLYVTNFQNDYNTLYRNLGGCNFEDVSEKLGLAVPTIPYMGWGPMFLDVDGDGDQDLYVVNGHIYPQLDEAGMETYPQRNLLFLNQLSETGAAEFELASEETGGDLAVEASSRGVTKADFDNDADSDLLVTNINKNPTLLDNRSSMRSPALRLTLVGRPSNRSAYGTRIIVESGGRRQTRELRHSDGFLGSNDPRPLVSLPGGTADRLEIVWPSGATTNLGAMSPGWLVVDEVHGVVARRQP